MRTSQTANELPLGSVPVRSTVAVVVTCRGGAPSETACSGLLAMSQPAAPAASTSTVTASSFIAQTLVGGGAVGGGADAVPVNQLTAGPCGYVMLGPL